MIPPPRPCAAYGVWSSVRAFGHDDQTRPALLICREPEFGDRAQPGLRDQVHELFRPPFVRRPTNGYSSVCLGAHRVFVADVCCGDEVSAWLQGAREQGEDLRKDVAGRLNSDHHPSTPPRDASPRLRSVAEATLKRHCG